MRETKLLGISVNGTDREARLSLVADQVWEIGQLGGGSGLAGVVSVGGGRLPVEDDLDHEDDAEDEEEQEPHRESHHSGCHLPCLVACLLFLDLL